jgi:aspartokinase/homoserine dehydrogenase 1
MIKFVEHIQTDSIPHQILIDCTSSEEISQQYVHWMKQGLHIITPNKKAGSGVLTQYQDIKKCEQELGSLYLYEATVGAGLPIISTLRDLMQTGDQIISIEGVLSGTLSYLMNQYNGEKTFSQLVLEAKEKGYTEPDPRDDLNGMDVGRKVVILARESGFPLSLDEMKIDSLVPDSLMKLKTKEEFIERISELDAPMEKLLKSAQSKNKVLRYTGYMDQNGEAKVGLREVDHQHPLARVQGTDNILLIRTQRYNEQPLIVQGPGAGPEVTAGGIFADLLRLARMLGAKT